MGIVFIALACLTWSLDTLIRYPLLGQGVSAKEIVFYEHLILCALFFHPIVSLFKKNVFQNRKILSSFFIIGMMGSALSTLAYTHAFSMVNPSVVILLQKLQPLIAILLARVVLNETFDKHFFFWASICFLGGIGVSYQQIFSAFSSDVLAGLFSKENSLSGIALALFAVFGWGASTVFGKRLQLFGLKSSEVMAGRFLFGFLAVIFYLPTVRVSILTTEVTTKLFLMALLAGVLGIWLYYRGLERVPARVATLAEMFFPLLAVVVNWIFLDKKLDTLQLTGGLFLILGSWGLQYRQQFKEKNS